MEVNLAQWRLCWLGLKAPIRPWWSLPVLSFNAGRDPAPLQEFNKYTSVEKKPTPHCDTQRQAETVASRHILSMTCTQNRS